MIDHKVKAEITACLIPHAINSVVIVKLTLLKMEWFLNLTILITFILIN